MLRVGPHLALGGSGDMGMPVLLSVFPVELLLGDDDHLIHSQKMPSIV
jgi:hypothetical protein